MSLEAAKVIPTLWNAPSENPNFVGREAALKLTANIFNIAKVKIAVIAGPSGFGKTQIAKRFLYKNYHNYDIVWWFNGSHYLQPQFENFALAFQSEFGLEFGDKIKSLSQSRLVAIIKEAIRRKGLKCLIIFDDVQTFKDIDLYIPFTHENNVHTIITTQNSNFSADAIKVNALTHKESLDYINSFLPNEEKDTKDSLVSHSAGCPTSIALAIDYIKSCPGMTIKGYLQKYNVESANPIKSINEAAEKLGSSIDGYKMDLFSAMKMNLNELKSRSPKAFRLVGFLSLLHHDAMSNDTIKEWSRANHEGGDVAELVNVVNQYSLIDSPSSEGKAYFSMNELIQKIVSILIPAEEKKQHIDEATRVLLIPFNDRSDKVVEKVLKNNEAFLHALRVSEEAHKINYNTAELTSLRIKVLDVIVGIIRDWDKAKMLRSHIEADLEAGIKVSKSDEILYNTNLFLFSFIYSPDFDKAIKYGQIALQLIETEAEMFEEKIRLYSNLIQYYCFIGKLREAKKFVEEGEKYFSLSKSDAYNALYVLAVSTYLNDRGEFDKVVSLIKANQPLIERQDAYPSMYSFTLNQLCHALISGGNIKEGKKEIELTEKVGRNFYDNEDNHFFARLSALKAMSQFPQSELFHSSKELLEKSLATYEKVYCGSDNHKIQGSVNLILAKLYYLNKEYEKARSYAIISEAIFDKVTKGKEFHDISELYKLLTVLGADINDEASTKIYLKKLIENFGLGHTKTQEAIIYLDKKGLRLPY